MNTIMRNGRPFAPNEVETEAPRLRNWETARAFLEIARTGSFRAASQSLHLSVNTLRRLIDEFEKETRIPLFTRHADGVRLTREAEPLVAAAQRMELASFDIVRSREPDPSVRGEVRLSVTEGLGAFWVAPRVVELHRSYPDLLIDLQCSMRAADIMRLESDVGIQITRPTANDLRIVKVGRMHTMPFASREYLARYGQPADISDFRRHRLVLQVAEQPDLLSFERIFPGISQIGFVSVRTNTSSAHFCAVLSGAGIGVLPTYVAPWRLLEPIDMNFRFAHDIWLVYHPDLAKTPRVRLLIDWLVEAFSPRRYPWFADDFIHPKDLPSDVGGLSLLANQEGR
jgi:DNA-binding transcriptional LysR family regulator